MKKGFTLVELLAVIVILAIIALIAVPIVLGIIGNTKESSILRSGEAFAKGVEQAIMKQKLNAENALDLTECVVISNKKLICSGEEVPIDIKGQLPEPGSVITFKNKKINTVKLYYDDKIVIKNADSNFFMGNVKNTSKTHIDLLESQIKEVYNKDIKIGDYVEYDETKGGTVAVGKNVKWRVLGIENDNLLLVSDQNIATNNAENTVLINGYYYDSEEQLLNLVNEPCKKYGYGEYAIEDYTRSITVEDINSITGYNPNRIYENNLNLPFHSGALTQYGNKITYTYETNESGNRILNYSSTIYKNNKGDLDSSFEYLEPKEFLLLDGTKLGFEDNAETKTKKSIAIKNNYYWYSPEILTNLELEDPDEVDEYNKLDKIGVKKGTLAYDMLFKNTAAFTNSYWLAGTYYFNTGSELWYGLRSVVNEKVGYSLATYYPIERNSDSVELKHGKNYSLGVRAVVKLSSDITLITSDKNTWEIVPGKIENDKELCILLKGEANTKGSKYSCEIKDGLRYRFYVISHNADGTTNLILEQNINNDGTLAESTIVSKGINPSKYNVAPWNNESGQSATLYGPVTAMTYLYKATKDWTNIEPINYTYNDKEMQQTTTSNANYTSFISKNGIANITAINGKITSLGNQEEPLRARMPVYSSDISKTEVTSKDNAPYLYANLVNNRYWTLSSYINSQVKAHFVNYNGNIELEYVNNSSIGIRPVITVKL